MNKKKAIPRLECDRALKHFHTAGISISQWARDNKFARDVVCNVLYGRSACLRGQAHEVAVALGIKAGVVVKAGTFKPRKAATPYVSSPAAAQNARAPASARASAAEADAGRTHAMAQGEAA